MRILTVPRTTWRAAAAIALVAPLVAGCGDSTKRALGWEKSTPDEFNIETRAPLTQPPDYNLRPPSPGSTRPTLTGAEIAPIDAAKKVLIGPGDTSQPAVTNASATTAPAAPVDMADLSTGEAALLKKAGAEHATSDVRRQVDEETTAIAEESNSFTNDLLFWQEKGKLGEVVDPAKERQRLEANSSLGKSVVDGDTPQIVRKQKGWLEGIF